DTAGRAPRVLEIAAARRGPGVPVADRPLGLPDAGALVSPVRARGRPGSRTAHDRRKPAAPLCRLWLIGAAHAGRPRGARDALDQFPTRHLASTRPGHARPTAGPPPPPRPRSASQPLPHTLGCGKWG